MEETIRPDLVITEKDVKDIEWSVNGALCEYDIGSHGLRKFVVEPIPAMRFNGGNPWIIDPEPLPIEQFAGQPVVKRVYAAFDTVTKEGFFIQFETGL